ncbi:MAG: hypothetical protein R2796_01230 [Chitinophagaceae bacterium]|nr:hypothetical protein [Chitinophagaceae bacterium]MCB0739533.1 hypothetical protein [Chitinophagaceae bacterium]
MHTKLYSTLLIGICFISFSCKTAGKLYEKGKYDEAVQLAAKKLQKKPNDAELMTIIQQAYDYAVQDHTSQIQSLSNSQHELKYEWIYNEYIQLQQLYDAIYKSPSVLPIVQPIDYSNEIISYRHQAGEVRFNRGIAFMQRYTKQSYKDAWYEFQAALRFMPGDVATVQKMQEAYEYAVTNIALVPMQTNNGYQYSTYTSTPNYAANYLLQNLRNNSGNQFVQFYSLPEANSQHIRIDQFIQIDFPEVQIGHVNESQRSTNITKKIAVETVTYKPDSIVTKYATVKAKLTTTTRSIHANMQARINILTPDGRGVWNDFANANFQWQTTFNHYTGDKRALSDEELKKVNTPHSGTPTQKDILNNLWQNINSELLYKIRKYVNRL